MSGFLGTIEMTVLPEISTKGLEASNIAELTERVYSIMSQEYEKCNNITCKEN